MLKRLFTLALFLGLAIPLYAQGNTTTIPSSGPPSSTACNFNLFVNDTTNGNIYFCKSGTLTILNGSSSSGAKTDLSNLASPTAMPAGEALCSSDTGGPCWTWGTNSITANKPVTVPALSVSGNFNAGSFSTTNSGVAGQFSYGQGTAPPENSSSVNVFAPTSVTTFGVQLPAVAPSVQSIAIFSAPSAGALTFNATPTAGGSSYVQGDVGSVLTLTCGATVAITQVNSGSGTGGVTGIATAATTPGSACTTETGKTTTGGTGTGATVNLTALTQITTQTYQSTVPSLSNPGLTQASLSYSFGLGGSSGGAAVTQNNIYLYSVSLEKGPVEADGITVYVTTDDTTGGNSYDIVGYGPGCYNGAANIPLAFHTGSISQSTYFGSTGQKYIPLASTYYLQPGYYCIGYTSAQASPTLKLATVTNSWINFGGGLISGGGATGPSTITAPALSQSVGTTMEFGLYY